MIIHIKTTNPLDAGPVNLHSRWDMLDWNRLTQRIFLNTAISGYWKVDTFGFMKRILLIGNTLPDIHFTLDMRTMDSNILNSLYLKLQKQTGNSGAYYDISNKKISFTVPSMKQNTHLSLIQLE